MLPLSTQNPNIAQRLAVARRAATGATDSARLRAFIEAGGSIAGGIGEVTGTGSGAGNLKDIFAPLTDVRPMHCVLQETVSFETSDELGGTYKFPAILSFSGGSIPAPFGTVPTTAVIGEGPVSPEIQFASAQGFSITTPIVFPFDMAAASQNGKGKSYLTMAQLITYCAKMEAERDAELSHLLGQFGLGVVAVGGIGAETPFTSARLGAGFYRDITFTKASTADGIWAGADYHRFDFFNAAGSTQRNTTGATTYCSIIGVQNSTATVGPIVRFFFGTTGNLNTLVAGDVVWRRNFKTAGGFNEALGLLQAFSIVGAVGTTIWGLDSGYTQWHATQYPVGGAMTFGKIAKGLQVGVSRANMKKAMVVLVGNGAWADLLRDLADLTRNNNPPPKTLKNGASTIEYAIQTGPVKIINHGFMPDGLAIAYPEDSCRRIGATEATDNIAGMQLSVMTGVTLQTNIFQNQAIINPMLGACTIFTGIINDA